MTSVIASIVVFLDVLVIYVGTIMPQMIYWSTATEGLVTFFGMLIVSSYHARLKHSSKGTMRRAIAGSLISVYVIVLALGLSDKFPNISDQTLQAIMEGFSAVIMMIVGFYFGSKGASEMLDVWKNKGKST